MIYQIGDREVQEAVVGNQWAYGQLFPEVMSPGPAPLEFKPKTHVFSSTFSDTVNVWNGTSFDPTTNMIVNNPERKGKLWIYFSPLGDLLSMSIPASIGVTPNTLNDNSVFYSSSNGPLPSSTFQMFDYREITLNASSKKNISILGYKKLRVTSAALVITQIGPKKNRSGLLKVGFGFKGAIETVPNIIYDNFQNYFNMSEIMHLNECSKVICRYRLPTYMTDKFAPFDPTLNIPYFFIYGEGISPTMSLEIKITRHFEGIVLPEYSSFHDPSMQPRQYPFSIQNEAVRRMERKENIIQPIYEPSAQGSATHQHTLTTGKNGVEQSELDEDVPLYKEVFTEVKGVIMDMAAEEFKEHKDAMTKAAVQTFVKTAYTAYPNASYYIAPIIEDIAANYDSTKTIKEHMQLLIGKAAKKGIKSGARSVFKWTVGALKT